MKKTYGSKFKSQIALEAIRGDKTIAEIAMEYNIHPNLTLKTSQFLPGIIQAVKVTCQLIQVYRLKVLLF